MKIAFIGLGAMGLPMARRLATAGGIDVVACDISSDRLEQAAEIASTTTSIAEAVVGADAIFTVLPADRHVRAVASELVEHVTPGQVFVDFSTIGPDTMLSVSDQLSEAGVTPISMALTRSTAAAAAGELVLFAGGLDDELAERFGAAFGAMSVAVRRTSGLAGAKALKLANNMIIACIDVAVCEALVLARAVGVSESETVALLRDNGADSWALANHIEKYVLPDDLGPGRFSTRYMAKDVQLFSEMALGVGVPAVLAGVVTAQYRGTVALGLGDHYHMIVKRWQETAAACNGAELADVDTDREGQLSFLGSALAGLQRLATEDGLLACAAMGVPRLEAAGHLQGGSAGNDYLASIASGHEADERQVEHLVEGLDRVVELAEDLSIPSFCYEIGRRLFRSRVGA